MKGYKIYSKNNIGFNYKEKYSISYNKAIQIFNDLIREEINEIGGNIVSEEYFRDEISSLREKVLFNTEDNEIISRKYPYILLKDRNGNYIANIYFWYKASYEYEEYDIDINSIVLKEIEVIE